MSKHISKQSNKTKFEEMWTKAKVVTDEVVAVLELLLYVDLETMQGLALLMQRVLKHIIEVLV